MARPKSRLILASGSRVRRALLERAGVEVTVEPADLDEAGLRETLLAAEQPPGPMQLAERLASAKAAAVSRNNPDALVIGADQILVLNAAILEKAATVDAARLILQRLRGRTHELHSAVALAQAGRVDWSTCQSAEMTMRAFSDGFLDDYIVGAADALTHCVGAYEYEGLGAQLFAQATGDFTTILGLPLLPLLAELRSRGVIAS